jgi:Glyoxalase superfamily protein
MRHGDARLRYAKRGGLATSVRGRRDVIKLAIPILHVSSAKTAEHFYCKGLGFHLEFAHRADETKPDPCYMGSSRDGVWLHVSSFSCDGVWGGVVKLVVDDIGVTRRTGRSASKD